MLRTAPACYRKSLLAVALATLVAVSGPAWPVAARTPPAMRVNLVAAYLSDGDTSLIEDAVRGLAEARLALPGRLTASWVSLATTDSELVAAKGMPARLRDAVEHAALSADLVIAWGDPMTDAAVAAAREYPTSKFFLVSNIWIPVLPPNLSEGSFADAVEAFIAGAAAAAQTRSGRIGFIEPVDRGPQRIGYEAGAYYANPRARVIVDFLGVSRTLNQADALLPPSWASARYAGIAEPASHDPRKAEEVALAQYDRGADIIYADAGPSSAGVFHAALRRGGRVIARGGVRSQTLYPPAWTDRVLAMMVERPDLAIHHLVSQFLSKTPLPRHLLWGLTYPQPQPKVSMIGFLPGRSSGTQARTLFPFLDRVVQDVKTEQVVVPYDPAELNEFFRRYPP
jgi:basic membrane lipoprotein Med (substrate-binding protein (PBP1-ABC) superfamily)